MRRREISGIILSGGDSHRMGSDKGHTLFLGVPLISYAIKLLEPFCNQLIISSNQPDYDKFGYPLQPDILPRCGPLGGIFSSLTVSTSPFNMILSCDMPLITPDILERILEKRSKNSVIVPIHGSNQTEPLCACYPREILSEIEKCIRNGQLAVKEFLNNVPVQYLDLRKSKLLPYPDVFFNINTTGDLLKAESLYRENTPDYP